MDPKRSPFALFQKYDKMPNSKKVMANTLSHIIFYSVFMGFLSVSHQYDDFKWLAVAAFSYTVWKLHNLFVTQTLHEINSGDSKTRFTIFTISGTLQY